MAQAGYTPISLFYSTTASAVPTAISLVNGELAININDGKLYYKDSGGSVQMLVARYRVVTVADAASVTINGDTTDMAIQTNTQAVGTLTINAPTGTPVSGQKLIFRLQSTNIQTFSWNAIFQGSTDLALPTASTGSSKYDYMGFIYNTVNSKWQMVAKNFGF